MTPELTPADRSALRLLGAAAEGALPPPADEREAHLRRALRWLELLEPTAAGGDELTRRGCRRLEALAGLLLEDLGHAIKQTTTRADGGPAARAAAPRHDARMATYYRHTSAERAAQVLAGGFADETGRFLTDREHTGVWIADRPLVDGQDLYEIAPGRAVLVVDVEASHVETFEWLEEGKPYREFLVPAAVLNAHARVRLATQEDVGRAAGGPAPPA